MLCGNGKDRADTNKPVVWIIDRHQWPRALLRAELIERGFEVIGFEGLREALGAFRHRLYERPRLIVLELKDLPHDEKRLRALAGPGIPVILLAGAAEERSLAAQKISRRVLLKRPFTIGRVAEEVERRMLRKCDFRKSGST